METLRFTLGVILPYVAVAAFLAGMVCRVYSWKKLPSPPITLFPAPPTGAANLRNTLQEALLFKSLFRADPGLWLVAWTFHLVLALILLGHFRVFANVDGLLMKLGMSAGGIQAMSSGVGAAAGLAIGTAAVVLLLRRAAIPRVREITGWSDCLALLLIGAVVTTGNLMRFGGQHFDLTATRSYFAGLASFAGAAGAPVLKNNLFLLHMCLAFLLIMLMPFSKLLHFGGIFFTQHLIRKH
jgi:nitrate reductase gamma subunit